jgi:hypothetical protein
LLDVLFILIFATLVQASAARSAPPAAAAPPPPPAVPATPPPPPSAAALRDRALATAAAGLAARRPVIARVGRDGVLRAIEDGGAVHPLGMPLVERVADLDVALRYLGDRSAELRLCAIVALRLGLDDLAGVLVVIAPDAAPEDLTVALAGGLRRDVDRCAVDQRGVAVVVAPGETSP